MVWARFEKSDRFCIGMKRQGQLNMTWKRQVEETNQIGLKRKDVIDRVKWCNGVCELRRSMR